MKTKRPKTKKTKSPEDDGKPTRALNAYNIFFSIERRKILEELAADKNHAPIVSNKPLVGFANLARMVSERWKDIDKDYKKELEEKARVDKIRHDIEMKVWNEKKRMEKEMGGTESGDEDDLEENPEDEDVESAASSRAGDASILKCAVQFSNQLDVSRASIDYAASAAGRSNYAVASSHLSYAPGQSFNPYGTSNVPHLRGSLMYPTFHHPLSSSFTTGLGGRERAPMDFHGGVDNVAKSRPSDISSDPSALQTTASESKISAGSFHDSYTFAHARTNRSPEQDQNIRQYGVDMNLASNVPHLRGLRSLRSPSFNEPLMDPYSSLARPAMPPPIRHPTTHNLDLLAEASLNARASLDASLYAEASLDARLFAALNERARIRNEMIANLRMQPFHPGLDMERMRDMPTPSSHLSSVLGTSSRARDFMPTGRDGDIE